LVRWRDWGKKGRSGGMRDFLRGGGSARWGESEFGHNAALGKIGGARAGCGALRCLSGQSKNQSPTRHEHSYQWGVCGDSGSENLGEGKETK